MLELIKGARRVGKATGAPVRTTFRAACPTCDWEGVTRTVSVDGKYGDLRNRAYDDSKAHQDAEHAESRRIHTDPISQGVLLSSGGTEET